MGFSWCLNCATVVCAPLQPQGRAASARNFLVDPPAMGEVGAENVPFQPIPVALAPETPGA